MAIDREAALNRAEKCLRQGRLDGAIEEYVRLVDEQPSDWGLVNALGDLYLRVGDTARAFGQFIRVADFYLSEGFLPRASALYKKALKLQDQDDHALSQLAEIASRQELFADAKIYLRQLARLRRGRGDQAAAVACLLRLGSLDRSAEALDALVEAADLAPGDTDLRARIAREYLAAGQVERARAFLTVETAGDDPDLLLAVAVAELRAGRDEAARALLTRLITIAPERDGEILRVAAEIAQQGSPERAYACVDIVTDAALLQGDMARAVASLQTFLRQESHVPALVRLVEICVDAGLDEPMREAQARLVDVYLETGRAGEARAISEDLLTSEPASQAHTGRLRRALEMLGVSDVEGTLAAYLEPDSLEVVPDVEPPAAAMAAEAATPAQDGASAEARPDVADLRMPDEAAPAGPLEIDLSAALAQLAWTVEASALAEADPPQNLDDVFGQMRSVVAREQLTSDAVERYERALADLVGGREEQAIVELESAARTASLRFGAAGRLGRLWLERGDVPRAVAWLEQAAEAPAPTPDEGFAVLFDLAAALEASGEVSRALAVLMELDSVAGGYRDVRAHIDRLSREQTGDAGP